MMQVTSRLLRFILFFQVCICRVHSRGFSFPWSAHAKNNENTSSNCLTRTEAQEQLRSFLQNDDPKGTTAVFHIQGWRWHTMSLLHEAERLHQLAVRRSNDSTAVAQAIEYVVGFQMKALHKIETDLFFPWVRQKVQSKNHHPEVTSALNVLLDELEELRQSVETLGSQLVSCEHVIGFSAQANTAFNHSLTHSFLFDLYLF